MRRHRTLNTIKQTRLQLLLELILCQPLEVCETKFVSRQIRLASHDPALEVKDIVTTGFERPAALSARVILEDWLVLLVRNGVAAYHPGVHVDACGVGQDAGGGLLELISIFKS